MLNWDHLRIVLVIRNAGSLQAAAEQLGMDRSTVIRRLDALETSLGARLFARRSDGCVLTEAGQAMIATLESIEASVTTLENRIAGTNATVDGNVTVALPPFIAENVVVPELWRLREQHPDLCLTLLTGLDMRNLARGEADVAWRNRRPEQNTLVARRIADGAMAFYASHAYLEKRGMPSPGFAGHDAVLPVAEAMQSPLFGTASDVSRDANVIIRLTDIATAVAAARAGLGLALLPCAAVIGLSDLVVVPPGVVSRPEAYLVTHAELRDQARIRAVMDFLLECSRRHEAVISGHGIASLDGEPALKRRLDV